MPQLPVRPRISHGCHHEQSLLRVLERQEYDRACSGVTGEPRRRRARHEKDGHLWGCRQVLFQALQDSLQ